jgi:hypothetical protein
MTSTSSEGTLVSLSSSARSRLRAIVLGSGAGAYFLLGLVPHVVAVPVYGLYLDLYALGLPVVSVVVAWLLFSGGLRLVRDFRSGRNLRVNSSLASGAIGLLGGIGAVVVHHALFLGLPAGSGRAEFKPSAWSAAESQSRGTDGLTPRQRMLQDVVENLPGVSRSEVERRLGRSLETPYFRASGRDLIYALGPGRAFLSLDSEWLMIWLDAQGAVARYAVVED